MVKIVQWNARSTKNKINKFSNFLLKFEVTCLQETWLHSKDKFKFNNYSTFRSDRSDNFQGGEVAILCKNSLDPIIHNIKHFSSQSNLEVICIVIKCDKISQARITIMCYTDHQT